MDEQQNPNKLNRSERRKREKLIRKSQAQRTADIKKRWQRNQEKNDRCKRHALKKAKQLRKDFYAEQSEKS